MTTSKQGRLPTAQLVAVWILCLLQIQLCSTQIVQVSRENGVVINLLQQTSYFIFEGDSLQFTCHCTEGITSLRWVHKPMDKDEVLVSNDECLPLTYSLTDATTVDSGEYLCEVTWTNTTITEKSAGILGVVDSDSIVAPPLQYGLIDTAMALNCSTTFPGSDISISITWEKLTEPDQSVLVSGEFDRVGLTDEGVYECKVFLGEYVIEKSKKVNFSIIVPPTIQTQPNNYNNILGNQAASFPVQFQSRFQQDTVIVWFKNGNSEVEEQYIQTTYWNEPNATTALSFEKLRREHSGDYRVAILNTFSELPANQRQVEASFTLDVTVPPVKPTNVHIDVDMMHAILTWTLTNENTDDQPDNITIQLYYQNSTMAGEYVVGGTETQQRLDLVPGMDYVLNMTAENIDGESRIEPTTFKSLPGSASAPHVSVVRDPTISSTLNLTVSLAYTGGSDITQLEISFRRIGAEQWFTLSPVDVIPTDNFLEWLVIVTHDDLFLPGFEFRARANNGYGEFSEYSEVQKEPIELPGAPNRPIFISSTHNSMLIQVQLSTEGDDPITSLDIDFLSHPSLSQPIYGPFELGELVMRTIGGLNASTQYEFVVVPVNYGGRGEASPSIRASTGPLPPVPLWGVVLISAGTAVAIILCLTIIILIVRHVYYMQKAKRQYRFPAGASSDTVKTLGGGGGPELVSGTKRPPLPKPPSQMSSTPSVSSDGGRPVSQSTYSRQGSTSTYPISPQRTISTSDGGSPVEQFQFERRDSEAMSNDSESEVNYPRYTYKVSPSPPNLSTPQLRAHSLHSMQSCHSTTTHHSGSTNSTRESLILSPTFSATNV